MTHTDWIGFIGVTILLIAFLLIIVNVIDKNSIYYLILNLVGAGIACYAAILLNYLPFIILEGCWTLASLIGIYFYYKKNKDQIGETDLNLLINNMKPKLNTGEYVFCTMENLSLINNCSPLLIFKEDEGHTVILNKKTADQLNLNYSFISAWITLTVHSSLEAVGLTAAFSKALTRENISCNVVSGYYHDHIFVDRKDANKAINTLNHFSKS